MGKEGSVLGIDLVDEIVEYSRERLDELMEWGSNDYCKKAADVRFQKMNVFLAPKSLWVSSPLTLNELDNLSPTFRLFGLILEGTCQGTIPFTLDLKKTQRNLYFKTVLKIEIRVLFRKSCIICSSFISNFLWFLVCVDSQHRGKVDVVSEQWNSKIENVKRMHAYHVGGVKAFRRVIYLV